MSVLKAQTRELKLHKVCFIGWGDRVHASPLLRQQCVCTEVWMRACRDFESRLACGCRSCYLLKLHMLSCWSTHALALPDTNHLDTLCTILSHLTPTHHHHHYRYPPSLHLPSSSFRPGAPGITPGVNDAYGRAYRSSASADFFCGIVPGSVLSQLGRAMNLEGAAGLALRRLSREGLSWVPTAGNVCTLLAFGIAIYLNVYLTGEG